MWGGVKQTGHLRRDVSKTYPKIANFRKILQFFSIFRKISPDFHHFLRFFVFFLTFPPFFPAHLTQTTQTDSSNLGKPGIVK